MNKKFSTLLAAFAMVGAGASAQTINTTPAPADSIVSGEYYYLADGSKYLSIVEGSQKQDSLVWTAITDADLTTAALWSVTSGSTVALGDYFTFTNCKTGNALQLATKGNGNINSKGIATFGWEWSTKEAGKALTYVSGGKKYALTSTTAKNDSLSLAEVASLAGTIADAVEIYPVSSAWRAMTSTELNEMYGKYFVWTVEGTGANATPQAKACAAAFNNNKFTAVDAGSATEYYLEVYNSGAAFKQDTALYLNLDTVYYSNLGTLIDSTKQNGGLVFGIDTLFNKNSTYTATVGKGTGAYTFTVYTNAMQDSFIVEVANVPSITASGSTFADNKDAKNNGFVSLVAFDGSSAAITAAAANANNVLPSIYFGQGTKAELKNGAYYIYNQSADSVYAARLTMNLSTEPTLAFKAGYEKAWLPSSQWAIETTAGKATFYNRESGKAFGGAYQLYATDKANVYAYGADTLTIVPVATEGQFVGYKEFGTAKQTSITELALQFHSVLSGSATPYVVAVDTLLQVDPSADLEAAQVFKLIPVDTFSIGNSAVDSLKAISYYLYNGKDTLSIDMIGSGVEKAGTNNPYDMIMAPYMTSEAGKKVPFIFRESTNEGQYQILPDVTSLIKDYAVSEETAPKTWTIAAVNVEGSSAYLTVTAAEMKPSGYFSLVGPMKPEYATVETGHVVISSVENPTMALSVNNEAVAVVRNEGSLKDDTFTADNFILWLDCVDTDTVKPLYLVSTQQTLPLTAEQKEAGVRYFLNNAGEGSTTPYAILNSTSDETVYSDSISFASAILANDTLYAYDMKKDTIAAKALAKKATANTFAFRVATDGYYVESQKDTTYLATVNGVLTTVEELKDALAFEVTKSTTTPSSNEGVSVATVKVVAGQGVVTISGAAGKKVSISNILGQTATVQILSSDNATIAAPAGVVVVAVEGEEAVKAIVK